MIEDLSVLSVFYIFIVPVCDAFLAWGGFLLMPMSPVGGVFMYRSSGPGRTANISFNPKETDI